MSTLLRIPKCLASAGTKDNFQTVVPAFRHTTDRSLCVIISSCLSCFIFFFLPLLTQSCTTPRVQILIQEEAVLETSGA